MPIDTVRHRASGFAMPVPMQIARSPVLTVREKFEALDELKLAAGPRLRADDIGFSEADIEHAIEQLERDALRGRGRRPGHE